MQTTKKNKQQQQQQPPATQSHVDWSELPKELLQSISKRLDSELYLLRFRSVCSTWRRSSVLNHPFVSNNNLNTLHFSLCKHNIFLIKPPGLQPWLIKISQNIHGQTHLWHPLSRTSTFPSHFPYVLDFNQIPVLDLGVEAFDFINLNLTNNPDFSLYPAKVVSTKWPGKEPPVILTYNLDAQLAVYHCQNNRWTTIINRNVSLIWTSDVCVFKGQPYAVDNNGRTVTIGLDSSVQLVAEPVFGGDRKCLVECEGELLLVDKYSSYESDTDVAVFYDGLLRGMRFKLFKLEKEEKRWVEVTSLGDNVLFLMDDCAFSASASDLCIAKGNCMIYKLRYEDLDDDDDYDMIIFQLDLGRILPLSQCPAFSNLFMPPPDWDLQI